MPGLRGKSGPIACFTSASLLMLALVCRGPLAFSQAQGPAQFPVPPGQNGGRVPPFGQDDGRNQDPSLRRAQQEAAAKRNVDRQRRIVADTDRILLLAQQLNTEADKNGADKNSNTPSLEAKKAEEIEKLARGVKERMKSE